MNGTSIFIHVDSCRFLITTVLGFFGTSIFMLHLFHISYKSFRQKLSRGQIFYICGSCCKILNGKIFQNTSITVVDVNANFVEKLYIKNNYVYFFAK